MTKYYMFKHIVCNLLVFYSVCTRYNEYDKNPFAKCKRSIKAYVLWCWLFDDCMWIALKGFSNGVAGVSGSAGGSAGDHMKIN